MHFLQSTWLWAIAGITFPVIIHLWNVKTGKVLKVGSIALLMESSRASATSLKLSELLLLILRCLILIALAMLLAKPFYNREKTTTAEKGWLLMEKQDLSACYSYFKPTIDSLLRAGFTFRFFEPGFEKMEWEQAIKSVADTSKSLEASYWQLVKSLNQIAPKDLPVYLFTSNLLHNFSGARPSVSMNLQWHVYPTADTIKKRVVDAFKTADNRIKVALESTGPTGTSYAVVDAASNVEGIKPINHNGRTMITDAAGKDSIPVDTSLLKVVVYSGKQSHDAMYLDAALRAIRDFTSRPISILIAKRNNNLPAADWLFWLSAEDLPSTNHKNIFVYASGRPEAGYAKIIVPSNRGESDKLYRRVEAPDSLPENAVTLWKDGYGKALLTREQGQPPIYRFYSHFDPAWNDLPWSSQFPEQLYRLLLGSRETSAPGSDLRTIDPQQVLPTINPGKRTTPKAELAERADLSNWFWLLAFVLFLVERWLSFRATKGVGNA